MSSRIGRKQMQDLTSDLSSSPGRTKLPTGPRTVKQEPLHTLATPTSRMAGSRLNSTSFHPLDIDRNHHLENEQSLSSPCSDNNYDSDSTTLNMENSGDDIKRIGQLAKKLMDNIKELGKLDLEHVVNLPKLILVGDQSAGKSSLMCALAGIHVPRDKGCCTRCPANIITTDAPTWSCTISLVQKYRYESPRGRAVTEKDFKKNRPFPFWFEQDRTETIFARLTEKSDLATYMQWAQVALLNHDEDYRQFIPETGQRAQSNDSSIDAKITPNVVQVEIFGPGLPALSFFDLPGIISNMPNPEEKYLVDVFENLAKRYIGEPNTLIIFAMNMTVDPVLSRAKKVIEDLDATDRCIGVLTKPDTLPDKNGNTDFENILRGKEHRLEHGWYVTKQPAQDFEAEEAEYHNKARREEKEFFEQDELWKGKWSEFQNKCGTEKIQTVLSDLLATSIIKTIPDIQKKINAHKAKIHKDLLSLPELPNQHVQLEVQRLLQSFSQDVKRLMSSEHTGTDFHGRWNKLSHEFHNLLLHIKPMIITTHPEDTHKIPVINIDSDTEEQDLIDAPDTSGKKRKFQDITIESHTPKQDGKNSGNATQITPMKAKVETPDPQTPRSIHRVTSALNPFRGTAFEKHSELGRGFASIGDIRLEMQNSSYGLPKVVDPRIHRHYCQKAVSIWKGPYVDLIFAAMKILRSAVHTIVDNHLGVYQQTLLYKKSKIAIDRWLDQLSSQQLSAIEDLYQTENFAPFTLIENGINENKKIELEKLQKGRHKNRASCFVDKQLALGRKKIKLEKNHPDFKKARQALVDAVTEEQIGRDPFEVQIDVAAYVRGYYLVAANRFADSVCISINNRLFRYVYEQVENYLEKSLGTNDIMNGSTTCQDLMHEDDRVASQRKTLQREIQNLEDFEKRFMKLVEDCNRSEEADPSPVFGFSDRVDRSQEETDRSDTPEFPVSGIRQQSPTQAAYERQLNSMSSRTKKTRAKAVKGGVQ